jgi:hypothetical protein
VTSLQTKRFSEQTQTAGNGDINDVTSEVLKAVEKPLIHHGLIIAYFRHRHSHHQRTRSEIDSPPATPFDSFIAISVENTKVLPRDWQRTISRRRDSSSRRA